MTYVWKVNGVTKQTTTKTGLTDTFDLSVSGNGSEGDAISVTVTPDDSDALGTPVSASATVGNTAPVVNSIAIDQASALTNDTLTTSVSTSDPDGDSVAVTYQWLKNGNPIVGQTGSSLDLSLANNGTRGDIIRVRATADDGQTTSPLLSATVTIGNSAPTATVSLAPTTPFTNDTLTATATKADADGNAVTLTYVWKVNGVDGQDHVGEQRAHRHARSEPARQRRPRSAGHGHGDAERRHRSRCAGGLEHRDRLDGERDADGERARTSPSRRTRPAASR